MKEDNGDSAVMGWPVVFTFDAPDDPGSVQTQLRHGAVVRELERREVEGRPWARVRYGWGLTSRFDEAGCDDEGWLDAAALVGAPSSETAGRYAERGGPAEGGTWLQVASLAAHGFVRPSRTAGPRVVVLPTEAWVWGEELTEVQAAPGAYGSRWWKVVLPSRSEPVYIQQGDVAEGRLLRSQKSWDVGWPARMMGRPYVWGGSSSFGFDCSGLVQFFARRRGVALPHSARRQFTETDSFSGLVTAGKDLGIDDVAGDVRSDGGRGDKCSPLGEKYAARAFELWEKVLRAGDIVYFAMGGKRVDHVGLFMGGDQMLHASSSRTPCVWRNALWDSVYAARMVGVRRLDPPQDHAG